MKWLAMGGLGSAGSRVGSKRLLGSLLLGSTALAGTPVLAQEAADAEASSDTIVVTSQRREQDLQDVPLSVQVLGDQQDALWQDYLKRLEAAGVDRDTPMPGAGAAGGHGCGHHH